MASLYGASIFCPISMSLLSVYLLASIPNIRLTFLSPVRFSIPWIGFVYLTPEVSTYIPISLESSPALALGTLNWLMSSTVLPTLT